MVGTVSHLVNVGITIYAQDWQRTVAKFTDQWPNCKVGPLPLVLREDSPGSTALLLIQLRHWFSIIYAQSESIVFNKTAWDHVIRGISTTYALPRAGYGSHRISHHLNTCQSQRLHPAPNENITQLNPCHHILL